MTKPQQKEKGAICGDGMCPYVPCKDFPKCKHVEAVIKEKEQKKTCPMCYGDGKLRARNHADVFCLHCKGTGKVNAQCQQKETELLTEDDYIQFKVRIGNLVSKDILPKSVIRKKDTDKFNEELDKVVNYIEFVINEKYQGSKEKRLQHHQTNKVQDGLLASTSKNEEVVEGSVSCDSGTRADSNEVNSVGSEDNLSVSSPEGSQFDLVKEFIKAYPKPEFFMPEDYIIHRTIANTPVYIREYFEWLGKKKGGNL